MYLLWTAFSFLVFYCLRAKYLLFGYFASRYLKLEFYFLYFFKKGLPCTMVIRTVKEEMGWSYCLLGCNYKLDLCNSFIRRVTWLCVIFRCHYERREKNHITTAPSFYRSNKLTLSNERFSGKEHLRGKSQPYELKLH